MAIPASKGLRPSLHGRRAGFDGNFNLIIDDRVAVINPAAALKRFRHMDDFFGDALSLEWIGLSGSDAQALSPIVNTVTADIGGICRLTSGNSGANMAADGSQLATGLIFQASNGDLAFETRVKVDVVTNLTIFAGFTDIITLEMPIESAASANTIATNASDAVGLFFDSRMTDDNWWSAGVAANTDAIHVDSGIAVVAATYYVLRVELDTLGNAKMYVDGNLVADVNLAVTAATNLCATVATNAHTAVTRLTDLDYMIEEMDR